MNNIINSRSDLDALQGTDAYGEALLVILGSATTWVNTAPEGGAPAWQLVTVLSTIQRMGFLTLEDLLQECAAAGIAAPPPPPQPAPPPTPSKSDLGAYLEAALSARLLAGIVVTTTGPTPVHCNGLPQTRGDLAGFYSWGLANPTLTRIWIDETGATLNLSGTQFVTLALAVGYWVDDVYAVAAAVGAQILAGSIMTTAQIDATVWPTS